MIVYLKLSYIHILKWVFISILLIITLISRVNSIVLFFAIAELSYLLISQNLNRELKEANVRSINLFYSKKDLDVCLIYFILNCFMLPIITTFASAIEGLLVCGLLAITSYFLYIIYEDINEAISIGLYTTMLLLISFIF